VSKELSTVDPAGQAAADQGEDFIDYESSSEIRNSGWNLQRTGVTELP
jgi:hypothetical protein